MDINKQIINHLTNDNTLGIDLLYKRYYKPLVLFADTILNDFVHAEDIVQEQIVKLWNKKLYNIINHTGLSSYLFKITKNACIDHLRKKDVKLTDIHNNIFDIAEIEAEQYNPIITKKIDLALNNLSDRTKEAITLVVIEELKYKEASEKMNISVNSLKTLLRRGMSKLREQLNHKELLTFLFFYKKK